MKNDMSRLDTLKIRLGPRLRQDLTIAQNEGRAPKNLYVNNNLVPFCHTLFHLYLINGDVQRYRQIGIAHNYLENQLQDKFNETN